LKLERERKDKREAQEEKMNATIPSTKSSTTTKKPIEPPTTQVFRSGVGKYISNQVYSTVKQATPASDDDNEYVQKKKRKLTATSSLNFSQW
jgi:hypothetical protein